MKISDTHNYTVPQLLLDMLKRQVIMKAGNDSVTGTLLTFIETDNYCTATLQMSNRHINIVDICQPYNIFTSGGCYILDYRIDTLCRDDPDLYAIAKVYASTSQLKDICYDTYIALSAC